MGSAAPLVAMIPGAGPEIAGGMAAVSELEKDGLATIDAFDIINGSDRDAYVFR